MRRLLSLLGFRRDQMERDLDRELRYHLDRRRDDLVQSGLTEADARRQAALELGGVTQVTEEVRDIWLTRWLRDFVSTSASRRARFSGVRRLRQRQCFRWRSESERPPPSILWSIRSSCTRFRSTSPNALFSSTGKAIRQAVNAFGSYNLMSYPICRDLHLQEQFFEGVLCRAATTSTSQRAESTDRLPRNSCRAPTFRCSASARRWAGY